MLCCESIVSSLFFFFSFFYTCKKKEFQSNFQINLVFFFSQHKVQIITNHSQRSHTSCDYPNTLSRMILRILRQKNHISLIFPSFFSSVLRFPSFFRQTNNWKNFYRGSQRVNAIVRSNTLWKYHDFVTTFEQFERLFIWQTISGHGSERFT